jgi:hypothetical protein
MTKLPKPPAEIPRISSLDALAPKFRAAVERIVAGMKEAGFKPLVFETMRTNARQSFLYGFGREYDDGRGRVTNARTAEKSWHFYGLGVDIVENDSTPWTAEPAFWTTLGKLARENGCDWGGDWTKPDRPHVQWGLCKQSPSQLAVMLIETGGMEAVWDAVRAN